MIHGDRQEQRALIHMQRAVLSAWQLPAAAAASSLRQTCRCTRAGQPLAQHVV
jgi:hypothetical protein